MMSDNIEGDYNAELDKYIEQLKRCEYIQDDRAVKKLCEKAKELLIKEENIIYLNAPITVSKNNNKNYNYNTIYRYVVTSMVNFTI